MFYLGHVETGQRLERYCTDKLLQSRGREEGKVGRREERREGGKEGGREGRKKAGCSRGWFPSILGVKRKQLKQSDKTIFQEDLFKHILDKKDGPFR